MTIDGGEFVNVREVRFNNVNSIFTVVSPQRLIATVPLDATTGPISVTTIAGSASTVRWFAVAPRIAGFTPGSGGPGTTVIIEGANFTGTTSVHFGGTNAASFSVPAPTQIHAVVPAKAPSGPITVVTPVGVATSSQGFVMAGNGPIIDSFAPEFGQPGTVVVVDGRNFLGTTAVHFSGTNTARFTVTSATQLTAIVPAGAKTGPFSITSPAGSAVSSKPFVVTAAPIVSALTPPDGPPGTVVTIDGANFIGATAVRFNGSNAVFSVTSDQQIRTTVPKGATTGPVAVISPRGTGLSPGSFVVRQAPYITGFAPVQGPPGTLVTIEGGLFTLATGVRFGTNAAAFTVVSDTQIQAIAPNSTNSAPISITSAKGTGSSAQSFLFVFGAPQISSFTPGAGLAGLEVILEGINFGGANSVTFNGTPAVFTVTAPTQIRTIVPVGATTGPISVTTPGGQARSSAQFVAAPFITGFSPTNGFAGLTIVIRGTNLTQVSAVKFNGTPARFSNPSAQELRAIVPSGATTGPISVTTPAGIVASTNSFGVQPVPRVALSIVPAPRNTVKISWPASSAEFVLQASPTLIPEQWATVTNQVTIDRERRSVLVNATTPVQFFRLQIQ